MSQASLFDLLDTPDWPPTPIAPVLETLTPLSVRMVDGYIKTWPANPAACPLFVLNVVLVDGHVYTPAVFALALGVTVETKELAPLLGVRSVRVKGEKHTLSLHDAVERNLAWEVKP